MRAVLGCASTGRGGVRKQRANCRNSTRSCRHGRRFDPLTLSDDYSRDLLRCEAVARLDEDRVRPIFLGGVPVLLRFAGDDALRPDAGFERARRRSRGGLTRPRAEHNGVRPHEAPSQQTPASLYESLPSLTGAGSRSRLIRPSRRCAESQQGRDQLGRQMRGPD